MKQAQAIILRAGDPTKDGKVFTPEVLRAVAAKNSGLFTYHSRSLYATVDLEVPSQVTDAYQLAMTYAAQVTEG